MTAPRDTTNDEPIKDQEILDLLAKGLEQLEPVPQSALDQAYGARFMAGVESELANLVFDSLAEKQPAMRRGGENESRFLSFTNDHMALDLSLLADQRTIVGEIDPAIAEHLTFEENGGESTTVPVDKFGRFRVVSGANSFRLRVTGHLITQWISRS